MSRSSSSSIARPRSGSGDPGRRQRLTRLEAGAAAQGPGKVDGVLGDRHRALQPFVAVRRQLGRRPVRQVDAVGGVRRDGRDEVAVERFGEERQRRGEHPGRRHERLVERRERGVLVGADRPTARTAGATAAGTTSTGRRGRRTARETRPPHPCRAGWPRPRPPCRPPATGSSGRGRGRSSGGGAASVGLQPASRA